MSLAVDRDVADAYAAWLAPHVDEVLAVPGFVSAERWRVEAPDGGPDDGRQRRARAVPRPETRGAQAYFDEHAERLRGDGLARFGGRFEASRRVLWPA